MNIIELSFFKQNFNFNFVNKNDNKKNFIKMVVQFFFQKYYNYMSFNRQILWS